MRSEIFLVTSLFLILTWLGGFCFLHIGGAPMRWLPLFALASLVIHFLTRSKAA